jgi:hypothetical protein
MTLSNPMAEVHCQDELLEDGAGILFFRSTPAGSQK